MICISVSLVTVLVENAAALHKVARAVFHSVQVAACHGGRSLILLHHMCADVTCSDTNYCHHTHKDIGNVLVWH